ncbi:Tetraspanin/Peripherin, partial [Cynara cardunculus var. scolymus]
LVAVGVVGFGVWISTHHDGCRKSLTLPINYRVSWRAKEQLYIIMDVFDHALLDSIGNSCFYCTSLNNTHNWKHLQSCLVKADDCSNLCGYPPVNASYYDLSFHPLSSNKDCKLYKNSKAIKCYNCDSCKAGVAQYMKTEWRVVAIFNVVLFVVLFVIYLVGCCARRNAASSRLKS